MQSFIYDLSIYISFLGGLLPDGDRVQHQPDQEVALRQPQKVVGPRGRRDGRDRGPTLSSGKTNSIHVHKSCSH